MKVIIGADQGAFPQKAAIVEHLQSRGIEVDDYGVFNTDSFDYPDIALPVAKDVAAGKCDFGILMCGTGIGVSLAANKVPGIRAAVTPTVEFGQLAKNHNNANIICLSGRFVDEQTNIAIVDAFIDTQFAGEDGTEAGQRHARRVNKIMQIEKDFGR